MSNRFGYRKNQLTTIYARQLASTPLFFECFDGANSFKLPRFHIIERKTVTKWSRDYAYTLPKSVARCLGLIK